MWHYALELDNSSKKLCTIITSFDKTRCNRFPTKLKYLPGIAKEIIKNICRHVEDTDVYIDDVGAFTQKGWENHIQLFHQNLTTPRG